VLWLSSATQPEEFSAKVKLLSDLAFMLHSINEASDKKPAKHGEGQ
jgi:hypothetical protein